MLQKIGLIIQIAVTAYGVCGLGFLVFCWVICGSPDWRYPHGAIYDILKVIGGWPLWAYMLITDADVRREFFNGR